MLIEVPEHSPADLAAWRRYASADRAMGRTPQLRAKAEAALTAIEEFARRGPCYASISWGKDSTVLAHLVWTMHAERGIDIPIVWVRREPIDNPHCAMVRDAFVQRFPGLAVREIRLDCERGEDGLWWVTGDRSDRPKEVGFRIALEEFGPRYLAGIRAEESTKRHRWLRRRGLVLSSPLAWWRADEHVFPYMELHDLPVHPAYGMTMGGRLDRGRLRVGSLTGRSGRGFGRREWELHYYGYHLERIGATR